MPKTKRTKCTAKHATVPYAKGFRPPTRAQQIHAITANQSESVTEVPAEFQPVEAFSPIPACTSEDDWLAQVKEEPQTYADYLCQCPWLFKRKWKYVHQRFVTEGRTIQEKYPDGKIYIVSVGDFTKQDSSSLSPDFNSLFEFSQKYLRVPLEKLEPIQIQAEHGHMYWVHRDGSKEKLKSRYDKSSGRYQLRADTVHLLLRDCLPPDALCMIALTMYDLYEDTTDLFVAGLAAGRHRVAIFSLFRYDPNLQFSKEFWYKIMEVKTHPREEQERLVLLRSCRLIVHEIGHLLGFGHCVFFSCLMNGSGHLEEDFRQPMYLCPVCLRKLHALTKCDIQERYQDLHEFYVRQRMAGEAEWVEGRLKALPPAVMDQVEGES